MTLPTSRADSRRALWWRARLFAVLLLLEIGPLSAQQPAPYEEKGRLFLAER